MQGALAHTNAHDYLDARGYLPLRLAAPDSDSRGQPLSGVNDPAHFTDPDLPYGGMILDFADGSVVWFEATE